MVDLIVTRAIDGYAKGDRVTDPTAIMKLQSTRAGRNSTVRVAPLAATPATTTATTTSNTATAAAAPNSTSTKGA